MTESSRLKALEQYEIMESGPEKEFDDITSLAQRLVQVPMAYITFIDQEKVWLKSKIGLDADVVPRDLAFCRKTIELGKTLLIPDLLQDKEFAKNPFVNQVNGIRFYLGVPVKTPEGFSIGTICVADYTPRNVSQEDVEAIEALSRQVMSKLELKKSLRMVSDQKKHFQTLLENLKEIVFQTDVEGKLSYLAPAWKENLGFDPEECLGAPLLDFVCQDDREFCIKKFAPLLNKEKEYCRQETRYRTKDGQLKWVEVYAKPLISPEGQVIGCTGTINDIEEKKVTEENLRLEKEKLDFITSNIGDVVWMTDHPKTNIIFISPSYESVWERKCEELLQNPMSFVEAIHPDDRGRVMASFPLQVTGEYDETYRILTPDGKQKWIHDRAFPIKKGSGGTRVVGIATDITVQKTQEELIKEQQVQIIAAAKLSSLGEMAAGVAHEINNPLTIIMGNTQILKQLCQSSELTNEDVLKMCSKIDSTVGRIAKIVSGLKIFAKDGSKDPFEEINLYDLIVETISFCEARFRNHHVPLEVLDVPKDLVFQCRRVQISQVMLNLLNNSYDAVVNKPSPWVKISVENHPNSVSIIITDSGPGISKDFRNKIMEPFFSTKDVGKGTGLGLSLSKGLVEAHKGELLLDTESKHTKFVIKLPKVHS
jgi:PAS domain S-box-containing protein